MIFTSLSDRDVAALIQAIKEFLRNSDLRFQFSGNIRTRKLLKTAEWRSIYPSFLSRTESLQVQYSSPIQ